MNNENEELFLESEVPKNKFTSEQLERIKKAMFEVI